MSTWMISGLLGIESVTGIEIARCQTNYKRYNLGRGTGSLDLSGLRKVVRVETALQMYNAVMKEAPFDIAICTAALIGTQKRQKPIKKIPRANHQFRFN